MKKINLIGQKFNKLLAFDRFLIKKRYHYKCKCDCGNITIINGSKLKNRNIKSCGCSRKGVPKPWLRKKNGESLKNMIVDYYRRNAKRKNLKFGLSKNELENLFKGKCFYCGEEPKNKMVKKKSYGFYIYNGIDRLDNSKGYIKENCVSCCKFCNYKKSNQNYKNFIEWIIKVYRNLKVYIYKVENEKL